LRVAVSLVTGASPGIGLAIAPAAEGFDLTISARSADALDKVHAELRGAGGKVVPVPADMGDERAAKPLDQAVMITADNIAELVVAVTRLSRWAAVPRIAVTRPRLHRWRLMPVLGLTAGRGSAGLAEAG
jgi:NADP-dependent 3-hydroxy acid dehydrogenase YdfG